MKHIMSVILLFSLTCCSTKHTIKVKQTNIGVLKMKPMIVENYKFDFPNFEQIDDYIKISNYEFDKIIKNNLRFKAIIKNNIDVANEKLFYYEKIIKTLGGVFDDTENIDIKK